MVTGSIHRENESNKIKGDIKKVFFFFSNDNVKVLLRIQLKLCCMEKIFHLLVTLILKYFYYQMKYK